MVTPITGTYIRTESFGRHVCELWQNDLKSYVIVRFCEKFVSVTYFDTLREAENRLDSEIYDAICDEGKIETFGW